MVVFSSESVIQMGTLRCYKEKGHARAASEGHAGPYSQGLPRATPGSSGSTETRLWPLSCQNPLNTSREPVIRLGGGRGWGRREKERERERHTKT